jgi:hypothetical protein
VLKKMHHGIKLGQLGVENLSTDYFGFYHKPCRDSRKSNNGDCTPEYLILDCEGRIIFNLVCADCGFSDVLKTHFNLQGVNVKRDLSKKMNLSKKILIELSLFKSLRGIKPWWPCSRQK